MSIEIRCYSSQGYLLFSYGEKQISDVKIIRQVDPSGLSVPLSTADFVLLLEKQTDYVYTKDQRFEIYLDNSFVSYTVLKDVKRVDANKLRFYTETILSGLSDLKCIGNSFLDGKSDVTDVASRILRDSGIGYSWVHFEKKVNGFLPTTNKIEALTHLMLIEPRFADVFSERRAIFKLFPSEIKKIDSSIISSDSYIEDVGNDVGFSLEYYSYSYDLQGEPDVSYLRKRIYETGTTTADGQTELGEIGIITIYFGVPTLGPSVSGGTEISRNGDEYVFESQGNAVVSAIQQKQRSNVKSIGSGSNVIKGMTLVNYENVSEILERLYSYYKSGQKAHLKIYEGFEKKKNKYGAFKYGQKRYGYNHSRQNQFNVGDKISFTLWGEEKIARIEKQTFKLTDGVIVKDTIAQILEE